MAVRSAPAPGLAAGPGHLHLDPLGGLAGDMFAAALLDLDPALGDDLLPLLRSVGLADDVGIAVLAHNDGVLQGRRFVVDDPRERDPAKKHKTPGAFVFQKGAAGPGHDHVPFVDILRRVRKSALTAEARERAVDIFTRLARAEGHVHGIDDVEQVSFHEVGAQDSVADVVTAAVLLDRLDKRHRGLTASVASIPLGSGRVQTAHGELPVPAPATLELLKGYIVHDDGRVGERVTPTGAAILTHLLPFPAAAAERRPAGRVDAVGLGFGTRMFLGMSNVLRVTLTTTPVARPGEPQEKDLWDRDQLLELSCDLDDMTGEELGLAADTLRATAGVVDVVTWAAFMKKGRPATTLKVLCRPAARVATIRRLFEVTSSLGVRIVEVERAILRRELSDGPVRVKRADRPGGATWKADVADLEADTLAERRARRHLHEGLAAAEARADED